MDSGRVNSASTLAFQSIDKMRSALLFLLLIISWANFAWCLTCFDCGPLYLPSGQCTQSKECNNGFCTYFNKTVQNRSNINFQCSPVNQLNAPGGSVFSTLNKCVEMREGNTFYRLKICNDQDLCNAQCNDAQTLRSSLLSPPVISLPVLLYLQIRTVVLAS